MARLKDGIPERTWLQFRAYIRHRTAPGRFVRAVLENNLYGAFVQADPENKYHLEQIVRYMMNEVPVEAWGAAERVEQWLKGR